MSWWNKKRWRRRLLRLFVFALIVPGLWLLAAWVAPFPHHLLKVYPHNQTLFDADGTPMRRVLGQGGFDAQWVPLDQVSPWAGHALTSAEDKRFYQHSGVDPVAIARCAAINLKNWKRLMGGSTISMQVIRLAEPRPRTLRSKIAEAFRATQMEMRYSKEEILEQYLNRAPFGGNIIGIQMASQRYLGKDASELSAGEAALLMGLPQRPSTFRPDRHPQRAETRRDYVLRRMREDGHLQGNVLLETGARSVPSPFLAPWYCDWVLSQKPASRRVVTSLNPSVQSLVDHIVQQCAEEAPWKDISGLAIVVRSAKTGEVVAMTGGKIYGEGAGGYVNTALQKRAPGSTLKPFAFAMAMQQGWLAPTTLLRDDTRRFRDYRPENMDGRSHGLVTSHEALVRSLNGPILELIQRLGVRAWLGFLQDCGYETSDKTAAELGLGAVLGGGMDTSFMAITRAYLCFADPQSPLLPEVRWWVSTILSGEERCYDLQDHIGDTPMARFAFKTGTSHGHRDAWVLGWNPEWIIGVWVGDIQGARVQGLSGTSHAVPILGDLIQSLYPDGTGPWFEKPDGYYAAGAYEGIRGVTRSEAFARPKPRLVLVEPADGLRVECSHAQTTLNLTASGASGRCHVFVNGAWRRSVAANESTVLTFSPGRNHIRIVDDAGRSDVSEVTVVRTN